MSGAALFVGVGETGPTILLPQAELQQRQKNDNGKRPGFRAVNAVGRQGSFRHIPSRFHEYNQGHVYAGVFRLTGAL